jgi:hypothetical protein
MATSPARNRQPRKENIQTVTLFFFFWAKLGRVFVSQNLAHLFSLSWPILRRQTFPFPRVGSVSRERQIHPTRETSRRKRKRFPPN